MPIKKATKASTALMLGTILAMGSRMYEDPMREFQTPVSYGRAKKKRALIPENVEVPIPSGCKEYYFKTDGTFEHVTPDLDSSNHQAAKAALAKQRQVLSGLTVLFPFKCIATNDKNAIKKFTSWLKTCSSEI